MSAAFRVLETPGGAATADVGVVVYSMDPETMALRELRGGADELFGYPREDWRRPGFFIEHLHPDDRQAARAFCREIMRERRSHELRYRLIDPEGRVLWIHDLLDVRRGDDGGQEIRGVMVDITYRIAREAEMQAAQRLRDELLRIAAEELAQPVRSMSGYADLLGRHLSAQRDDVGSDYAVGVRDAVQRIELVMARLIWVAQSGGESVEALAHGLAAIRAPARDGDGPQQR